MNKLNELIRKTAAGQTEAAQQLKRDPAAVIAVDSTGLRATVQFINGSTTELLNKTGECLHVGDDVWVEYRTIPSSGFIVMRNGAADPLRSIAYSTEERRVGKWIDDSDLFEKTYVVTALGDSSTRSVSVPLDIQNLGEIVESRGQLLGSGFSRPLEAMPVSSDGASADFVDATCYTFSTSELTVYNGNTDQSSHKAYVTIRYTKGSRYTTLEYIRSTGQQYIDLDFIIDGYIHRVEIDCQFTNWKPKEQNDNTPYFGAELSTSAGETYGTFCRLLTLVNSCDHTVFPGGTVISDVRRNEEKENRGTAYISNPFSCWCDAGSTPIGGSSGLVTNTPTDVPPRIFGYKTSGQIVNPTKEWNEQDGVYTNADLTLFSLTVKMIPEYGNTLLHKLIPARRDSDGEIGLLDEVTGTFYTNGSSTPFVIPT